LLLRDMTAPPNRCKLRGDDIRSRGSTMNSKLIPGLIAAALTLGTFSAAEAQRRNPPYDLWCRDARVGFSSVPTCYAYTYQQCMASRSSHVETCYLNPRYHRYRGR
jgi:hypothetical protein